MSYKKSRTMTRVHFEPSSSFGEGPSKPTYIPTAPGDPNRRRFCSSRGPSKLINIAAVKGAPEHAIKLLKPVAPGQDIKMPTVAKSQSRRLLAAEEASTVKRKAGKHFSRFEWDLIWSKMLCIECYSEGREVRGLSKDHPQHVTGDVSGPDEEHIPTQAAKKVPKSKAKDRGQHKSKSAQSGAEPCLPRPVSQQTGVDTDPEEELILWDNRKDGKGWRKCESAKESDEEILVKKGEVVEMGYLDALITQAYAFSQYDANPYLHPR